jgi:hypothetical protein
MDLSMREVAGLPKVGGTIESPLESPTPRIAKGGGASPCAFALLRLSLGRWCRWLSAKGGERVLSCGRVRVGAA